MPKRLLPPENPVSVQSFYFIVKLSPLGHLWPTVGVVAVRPAWWVFLGGRAGKLMGKSVTGWARQREGERGKKGRERDRERDLCFPGVLSRSFSK